MLFESHVTMNPKTTGCSSMCRSVFQNVSLVASILCVVLLLTLVEPSRAQDTVSVYSEYTMDELLVHSTIFDAAKFRRQRRVRTTLDSTDCKTSGCGDHGQCASTGICVCDQDSTKGYWQVSIKDNNRCTACMIGFAGSNCLFECQGGSCNICNGNGVCSQDVTGDGTCTCYRNATVGFWSGSSCSTCASGYFGAKCQNYCPGVDKGTPCGGRGECKTDANGNGACACVAGYGADSGCEFCDLSHYSVACSLTCPGYVTSGNDIGKPCSGHGKCFNGTAGNGTCVCDPFYGLEDCSKRCLNACSGHGVCSEGSTGTGQCSCDDRYAPPDCGSCIANRTGVECEIDCPVNSDFEVCNDHGACNYTMKVSIYSTWNSNVTRRNSTMSPSYTASATYRSFCTCAPGYRGDECDIACSGTADNPPCNGHGVCSVVGGVSRCTCFQSNDTGFWAGDTCSTCSATHNNSLNCNVLCPAYNGVICSGHGYCAEGYCYCQRRDPDTGLDYCNTACQESSLPSTSDTGQCSKCGCLLCTTEFQFGTTCRSTCPGTSNGITCSGNGVCSEGKTANGTCLCAFGFAGADCSVACPFSTSNGLRCSGFERGTCQCLSASSSTCTPVCSCRDGFSGSACEQTCPIVNGKTCSGHGTCDSKNATCLCVNEYTGRACNVPCGCNTENGVCDKVACEAYPASSVCNTCICKGNFTGVCNLCKAGTQGLTCSGACVHGTTSTISKECICEPNWSTASCTVRCPVGANGLICGGNGTCASGSRFSGLCACNASIYGSTCEVFCTLDYCEKTYGMLHPQCNLATGACECRSDASGYWTGTTCSDCVYGYWGASCTEACDCSGHGSCDSVSCYCSQDATSGFYTGTTCDTCTTGYIGASCNIRDVAVTRVTRNIDGLTGSVLVAANATFNNPKLHSPVATVAAVDEYNNAKTLFVGSRPVVQFDTSGSTLQYKRTTQGNTVFYNASCTSTSPPDAAYIFVDKQYAYFLMQPMTMASDGCSLPIRLIVVDRQTLALVTTLDLNTTTVNNTNEESFNETVRVTAATAQYDTGDTETAVKPRLVFLVAQTSIDATTTFYAPFPGGWVVHVDVEELMNKQSQVIVSYRLPRNFVGNDVSLSPYTPDTLSVVAVAGFYVSSAVFVWDVLAMYVFQGNHSFSPAFNNQMSIKASAPCWTLVTGGADAGTCSKCTKAERVEWIDNDLLVAMSSSLSNTDTILVWFRRIQDMDPGSSVYATTSVSGSICDTLTLRSDLVAGLTLEGNTTRVLASCSTFNCPEAMFHVELTQTGTSTSQATAMIHDTFSNVTYVALRVNAGNSASVIAKCSVVSGSFAVYGLKTLSFVTNSAGSSKPEVILSMAIAKNARMLFAPVSGVQSLSVVTILLYEIRSIAPDIADQRNNTIVTLYGSGYSRVLVPGVGSQTYDINCQFGSTFTPATIVSSTEITCYAPTESETSSAQSCGEQALELSLYNQSFPTANNLFIQRAQSAKLTSVFPVRGAMVSASKQVINITGTGFQDSKFSLCKFYSNSSLSRQTLTSPVTLVTPNFIQCTQPNATEPSYDTALLDVSIDGQLWTIDGPIVYEIVGTPAGIQNTPSTITVKAAEQTNFTFTTYIVDIRQHRLENLDLEERVFYLLLNISYDSDCSATSWRPEKNCVPGLELFNASYPNASRTGTVSSLYNAVPCHNESLNNVPSDPRQPWIAQEGSTAFPIGYDDDNSRVMYDGVKVFARRIPVRQGKVDFTDLFFAAPRTGNVTLTVTIPNTTWITTTTIFIVPGDPFALAVHNMADFQSYSSTLQSANCSTALESKFFITANTRLAPIELVIVDRMANIVSIASNQYAMSSIYYFVQDYDLVVKDQSQSIPTPTLRDNRFIYSDIILAAVHGAAHYVKFSALDRSSGTVYNTTTPPIRTKACNSNDYYKVPLESTCLPCPGDGSVCDGSELIVVEPGYWRANGSTTHIYKCTGGATICLGSLNAFNESYCAPGHTGPLCANCIAGYGQSGTNCVKCDDISVSASIVGVVILLVFIVLIIWTIITLRNAETTDLSVIMRTVVNHMQATGELGAFSTEWGPFMQSFVSGQQSASGGVSVNGVQAFDCLLRGGGQNYTAIFAAYMCLPGVALVLALVVFGVVRGLNMVPVITPELRREIEEDIKNFGANARTAMIKEKYPMYMVVVTTNCVIMFTLYQNIIKQCADALQCATFVYSDLGVIRLQE